MSKTIIITGASGGLGKVVVKNLSEDGHNLYVTTGSKQTDAFDGLSNLITQAVDLTDGAAAVEFVSDTAQKADHIHAGIFLVGGYAPGDIHATDHALLEKMFNLNFYTAFNMVKPLMEHFESNGGGQFIFIGARPALEADQGKGNFAYALSKSLIFKMADFINSEGKSKNITATVLVPSTIDTPLNREVMPDADFSKWVAAEDIAASVSFVLSEPGSKLRETVLKVYNND